MSKLSDPDRKQTRETIMSNALGYAGDIRRRYLAEVDPAPVCGLFAMASELDRRDRELERAKRAATAQKAAAR